MPSKLLGGGEKLLLNKRRFLVVITLAFGVPLWASAILIFRRLADVSFVLFEALLALVCGFVFALLLWWYLKPHRIRAEQRRSGSDV